MFTAKSLHLRVLSKSVAAHSHFTPHATTARLVPFACRQRREHVSTLDAEWTDFFLNRNFGFCESLQAFDKNARLHRGGSPLMATPKGVPGWGGMTVASAEGREGHRGIDRRASWEVARWFSQQTHGSGARGLEISH